MENIRRQNYYKILYLNLEQKEIIRRHNALQERLLEKNKDQNKKAKTGLTDTEKLNELEKVLGMLGMGAIAQAVSNTEDLTGIQTGNVHKKGASIAKMLMSKYGLTDIQAAAIIGNFIRESGLTPYNVENSSPYNSEEPLPPPYGAYPVGYGWAQWTGGRLNTFIEKFLGGGPGKRGKAANDGDNWRMLTYELDGPFNHVIQGLKGINDITEATIFAEEKYEGASIKANDERINAAKGVLKELKGPTPKAKGGIVIPEIFGYHKVEYDTISKPNLISNFIIDKPTIINTLQYNEPLIIIPLGRPVGISILKMLFKRPFEMIEQMITRKKTEEYSKSLNQIEKQPLTSRRTTIPKTTSQSGSTSPSSLSYSDTAAKPKNEVLSSSADSTNYNANTSIDVKANTQNTLPSNVNQVSKKTFIDTVSQTTEDIFNTEIYLMTQDIIVEE